MTEAVEEVDGPDEDSPYPPFTHEWWREPASLLMMFVSGGARSRVQINSFARNGKMNQYVRREKNVQYGDHQASMKDLINLTLRYLELQGFIEQFSNFAGQIQWRQTKKGDAPMPPKASAARQTLKSVKREEEDVDVDEEPEDAASDGPTMTGERSEREWLALTRPVVRVLALKPHTMSQLKEELQYLKEVNGEKYGIKLVEESVNWLESNGWAEIDRTGSGIQKFRLVAEPFERPTTATAAPAPSRIAAIAARAARPEESAFGAPAAQPAVVADEEEDEAEVDPDEVGVLDDEDLAELDDEDEGEFADADATGPDDEEAPPEKKPEPLKETDMGKPYYTVDEAAKYVDVAKVSLLRLYKEGGIKGKERASDGVVIFKASDLNTLKASMESKPKKAKAKTKAEPADEAEEPAEAEAETEADEEEQAVVTVSGKGKETSTETVAPRKAKRSAKGGKFSIEDKIGHLIGNYDREIMSAEEVLEFIRNLVVVSDEG